MIDLDRLRLLFVTARHLSARQLAARASLALRRRARRIARLRFSPPAFATVAPHEPLWRGIHLLDRAAASEEAGSIAEGRFRFLNREVAYANEPDWHDASVPQLWRYHLHYFDYVRALAVARAYPTFVALTKSWMDRNEQLAGDGWHPYTASVRVVNWAHALHAFRDELQDDPAFASRLTRSIYGQVRFVAHHLELDVRGNHLLKNLRALLWGGIVFNGEEPRRWMKRALELLKIEIAEQVLADGGHFERAPGYHLAVLKDVIEMAEFLRRNRTTPQWLDDARERMIDFLDALLPPDGRLPLFKDTSLDDAPMELFESDSAYATLLFGAGARIATRVARPAGELRAATAYAITRSRRHHLVVDVGKPCPEYLPAHAHADMFSFELTVDGVPQVVDAGVYEYQEGPWRDYFRSTRAHNTVEVDGANQSEVWGSFRVGRRAMPKNTRFSAHGEVAIIQAAHDGYERLHPPVTHRRTIASVGDALWIVVDDLFGSGHANAASRIHHRVPIRIAHAGSSRATGRAWFSPRFGDLQEMAVTVLRAEGPLPLRIAYAISADAEPSIAFDGDAVIAGPARLVVPVRDEPYLG